jgi:DNA-binding NarL/FixJ family response regulator
MELATSIRVLLVSPHPIMLTGLVDDKVTDEAMLVGARGILRKEAPVEAVIRAIEGVHSDQFWLDRAGTSRSSQN